MRSSLTKEQVAQAVITQMERYYKDAVVETNLLKNYKKPVKVVWKSNNTGYKPDIKLITSWGETKLFEIELDHRINEEKWRLLSLYAKMKKGDFTLVVPEHMISRIETIFAEKNFKSIKLMYVPK
jgi:hypothetical protein